jgi:AcrR family transcriptional regulator
VGERLATRRNRTRQDIIDAAWLLAERDGLNSLTLRDLAAEVGMRAPSLYSYFDGKAAIYDEMFARAYRELDSTLTEVVAGTDIDPSTDRRGWLVHGTVRWLAFCQASVPRYQLMFTRVIPGWEPAPDAYAASVASFARARDWLARAGITADDDVDLLIALISGLAAQQIANDPAGRRWVDLVDRVIQMFLRDIDQRRAS